MEFEGSLSYSQTSLTGPHHEPVAFGLRRLILFVYVHLNNIFPVDYFLHVVQTFSDFLMSVRPSVRPPLLLFVCASSPRRGFKIFNFVDLKQNCRVSPVLFKIGQKYRALYIVT